MDHRPSDVTTFRSQFFVRDSPTVDDPLALLIGLLRPSASFSSSSPRPVAGLFARQGTGPSSPPCSTAAAKCRLQGVRRRSSAVVTSSWSLLPTRLR